MKKHTLFIIWLLLPLMLWGQTEDFSEIEIDMSEVVLVEDAPSGDVTVEVEEPLEVEVDSETLELPEADPALDSAAPVDVTVPEAEVTATESEMDTEQNSETIEMRPAPVEAAAADLVELAPAEGGESEENAIEEITVPAEVSIPEATESLPEGTEIVLEIPGQGDVDSGEAEMKSDETISIDFPDEDVRTIVRNVADLFELNLVIPDTLQGRTTVKLRNVSWRQAFEVVLEPLGFTFVEDRNIISVKSIEELTTEPVDTRVFVINYAQATDLRNSIEPLINGAVGGRIQVDVRSNALVVTERPSRMNKIQLIIEGLDKATDQVMIESRFVEVTRDDARDIGVDWTFISDDRVEFPALGAPNQGAFTPSVDGAGFGGFTRPGDFASGLLAVFSEDDFAITLNALQANTETRLVSNPTVVVMNNSEANFRVGEDYPIRQLTINSETGNLESGQLEYRFVGIELTVTPSVNDKGMISLDINPKVEERLEDEFVTGPGGLQDQIFRTREAQTTVTIKDGYTIALGGLTEETESSGSDKIPLLGEVPVLGKLFQSNSKTVSNSNLIIFLTARTLNPDGTTYREIIDPRVLDSVGHTELQTPGYKVSDKDIEILRKAEEVRSELELLEQRRRVEMREFDQREQNKSLVERLNLGRKPAGQ